MPFATPQTNAAQLDALFKALASEHRRAILGMLSEADSEATKTCCAIDEVCACKISDRLGLAPSTISHHVSVLRDAGLISVRKQGTWSYYSLNRSSLGIAAAALNSL